MTKIERVNEQITRKKEKIAELTEHLRGLERQKTDIENVDILKMIHGFNVSKDDIQAFLQSRETKGENDSNSNCATEQSQNPLKPQFKEGGTLINAD